MYKHILKTGQIFRPSFQLRCNFYFPSTQSSPNYLTTSASNAEKNPDFVNL